MHVRILTALAVLVLLLTAGVAPAAEQPVGINSAVNTDAIGTPPGAQTRPLAIGQKVVHNEHIVTDKGGQVQILFLDESAMTIGPNSDVTIDEFVYDPATGKGKLAMNAARGVMRFVGGKISKLEDGVTMRTPTGTIGIRGGIFVMDLQRSGALDVVFVFGKGMSVTGTNGVSQIITRPGFGVTVAGAGAAPTAPARAPEGTIAGMLAQLGGKPGANGGAKQTPTDASVASSGVSNTISGNVAASDAQAAAQTRALAQPTGINVGTVQNGLQVNTISTQSSVVQSSNTVEFTDGFVIALRTDSSSQSGLQDGFRGTLINGQLVVPAQGGVIDKGGTIPLPDGRAKFGPAIISPGDTTPAVGSTFLVPDRSAFTAVVSDFNAPFGAPNGNTTFLVGGVPTVNLPTAGVGTFTGVANGAVDNQGSLYVASGNFSASYNFAAQSGTATFSNFDGRTFSGPIAGAGGNNYAGPLSGQGLSGAVGGKFFGNGASSTGGLFAVTSNTYAAVGVYAGGR